MKIYNKIKQFSISLNVDLAKDSNLELGTIFLIKDKSFSEFDLVLLGRGDRSLIISLTDCRGEKVGLWETTTYKDTSPIRITTQLKEVGNGACFELYINEEIQCKQSFNNFFWSRAFEPKFILGSPIGSSFPCKISCVKLNEFLTKGKIDVLGKLIQKEESNLGLELGPGKHAIINKDNFQNDTL
ncbi:MAG: hypothetical protein ACXAAH_14465 [Promethearchaeota archaeon]|jgi:hypothetical protein